MRKLRKLYILLRSSWKNVIMKRKLKPFILLFTDKEFKAQIDSMYELTKNCTHVEKFKLVRFGSISPGHRIVYPDYVASLTQDSVIPHIKVCRDRYGYRVIDGNHRFEAMKRWIKPDDLIFVSILV